MAAYMKQHAHLSNKHDARYMAHGTKYIRYIRFRHDRLDTLLDTRHGLDTA